MSATTIAPGQQAAFTPEEEFQRAVRGRRLMTWLLVFAIVMFFAGLTSAYVVSKSSTDYWVSFSVPRPFFISTGIILVSSVFLQLALMFARRGRTGLIAPMLAITLILGVAFSWFQLKGWSELADRKLNFVSEVLFAQGEYGKDYVITAQGIPLVKEGEEYFHPDDMARATPLNADMAEQANGASQYFHVLTRAHYAHVAFGLLALVLMLVMAMRHRYSQRNHVGLWAGTVYWHFLGGLWVYLLLFLLIVH